MHLAREAREMKCKTEIKEPFQAFLNQPLLQNRSSFDRWCDSSLFWLVRSYIVHCIFIVKVVESHSTHSHFTNTFLREESNVYDLWVSTWVLREEPSITETWLTQLAHTHSSIWRSLRMGADPITTCLQESGSHNTSVTTKCMLVLEALLEMANIHTSIKIKQQIQRGSNQIEEN